MTKEPVWISPSARARTAVVLMKGHNIGALPVVESNDNVIGIITQHDLLGVDDDRPITEVMKTNFSIVGSDILVIEAAEIMQKTKESHVMVIENGRLIGIVSSNDLISELGKTFDPLTGLAWSDVFREWAVDALKKGIEITIILFDLDQFGKFNKRHGHVIGDTVLKSVADVLLSSVDSKMDCLCRYGGDEFAIVSRRTYPDIEDLAQSIQEKIAKISIPEVPEGVRGTYGVAGGRRGKEREDVHYASTVDNLINRASKECIAKKPKDKPQPESQQSAVANEIVEQAKITSSNPESRLRIHSLSMTMTDSEVSVTVTLSKNGDHYSREVSGYMVAGKNTLRLVAEAAAAAVSKSLPSGCGLVVDDVIVNETGKQEQIVTVIIVNITPDSMNRMVGSAIIPQGDNYRAAAAAVLAAVNRKLESEPAKQTSLSTLDFPTQHII